MSEAPDNREPLVSILLPVYNGETYLTECLDSIVAQTYKNWTLTIVNNCSKDRTLQIAQSYASRDRRIRIHINEQFLPLIENHNHALRQLDPLSKYCKLIFADDWLYPDCLRSMVQLAEAHPNVGAVSAYGLRNSSVLWTGLPYPSTVLNGREVCRQRLMGGPYVFGTGTSHMFRSEVVSDSDPFYNVKNLHCDSEVFFKFLQKWDFGFVHQVLHYTRAPGEESYTTVAFRLRTLEAMVLYEFLTYGPVFLTRDEFEALRPARISEYYDFLAQMVLQSRKSWEFHQSNLSQLGMRLDRTRLFRALLKKAGRAIFLHPLQTIRQLTSGTSVVSHRLSAQEPK